MRPLRPHPFEERLLGVVVKALSKLPQSLAVSALSYPRARLSQPSVTRELGCLSLSEGFLQRVKVCRHSRSPLPHPQWQSGPVSFCHSRTDVLSQSLPRAIGTFCDSQHQGLLRAVHRRDTVLWQRREGPFGYLSLLRVPGNHAAA